MKFLKRSARAAPRISLVLVDWSVRESFHILHYLSRQTAARELFEVVIVEYYDRVSPALEPYADQVDTWLLLEMPSDTYYHKHLMYNAGIVAARGEIVLIGDSDAMVQSSFIASILAAFDTEPNIVLHLDQFRNARKDLYPFCFPSFEDVLGPGCINNADGVTTGLVNNTDPVHALNYGACMCARRADLIEIGGADEHIDFLGHICGPYDMTFRLHNAGRREVWHEREFTYHTWHPGAHGVDNYLGPHDGRHMSSTSLDALASGRVMPLIENAAIRALRLGETTDPVRLQELLILPQYLRDWRTETILTVAQEPRWRLARYAVTPALYNGYRIDTCPQGYVARPVLRDAAGADEIREPDIAALLAALDRRMPRGLRLLTSPLAVRFGSVVGRLVTVLQRIDSRLERIVRVVARDTQVRRLRRAVAALRMLRPIIERDRPVTVLVASHDDVRFLRTLMSLRWITPVEPLAVLNRESLEAILLQWKSSPAHARLVIFNEVYAAFYPTIAAAQLGERPSIV